tara:strand:- start:296 stop:781 length:486 start_codon:yes stop_codon:yes gene_type:complete
MSQIENNKLFYIILIFSVFALIFAYIVEYVLGHKPCNLCLYERIPYFLSILIIVSNLIIKKFERITIFLLFLIFLFSTCISFYHFGIEQGFIKESLVCDANIENLNLSKESLLKELEKKIVSCKDVTFRIFGLSLATINTIFSLIFSVILLNNFTKYGKNR